MNREESLVGWEQEDDSWMLFDGQQALVNRLDQAGQDHLQELTQQPTGNDPLVRFLLSQWNFEQVAPNTTIDAAPPLFQSDSTDQAYPPLIQSGVVAEQHRPYAAYGHLDRATLAQEFEFDSKNGGILIVGVTSPGTPSTTIFHGMSSRNSTIPIRKVC